MKSLIALAALAALVTNYALAQSRVDCWGPGAAERQRA
jgi:hypothetical protein